MENLIELVKARPFLYDSNNNNFNNREKRVAAWNQIAEKMGTGTGNHWRSKWNTLKENYSKFKKIIENPWNTTYKKYRNWPWAENMRFLDDFPTKRMSKKCSLNVGQIKNECPIKISESFSDELLVTKCTPNTANVTCRLQPEVSDELSDCLDISKNDLINKTSIKEDLDDHVEDIQVIIQGDSDDDNDEFGEVEKFFMSYAQRFKRLPIKLQRVFKLEMVTLFARYELQAECVNAIKKGTITL